MQSYPFSMLKQVSDELSVTFSVNSAGQTADQLSVTLSGYLCDWLGNMTECTHILTNQQLHFATIFIADRNSRETQLLSTQYSIDIKTPEKVIGAIFYSEERLLVYSSNILVIVSLSNSSEPVYKYLENFHPHKLGKCLRRRLLILYILPQL